MGKRNLYQWFVIAIIVINLVIFSGWLVTKLTKPAHAQIQQSGRYQIAGNGHTQRFVILDTMTGEYWQMEVADVNLSDICGPWSIRGDAVSVPDTFSSNR